MRSIIRSVFVVAILGVSAIACNAVFGIKELDYSSTSPDADGADTSPLEASPGTDGSANDSSSIGDGDGGAVDCDPSKAFGTPTLVPNLNSGRGEANGFLSRNGLALYFTASGRPTGNEPPHLWLATRSKLDADFGAPQVVAKINSPYDDFWLTTADEMTIYFASSRETGVTSQDDIWTATRSSANADFGTPTKVANINSTFDERDPTIALGGAAIFFASNRTGGSGEYDLYVAKSNDAGVFDAPSPITELNSAESDAAPVLSADGLTIYFASYRSGGIGGSDIWRATRGSTMAPFGTPTPVMELNTALEEYPTSISADGCTIYLTSNRPAGAGGVDLWVAKRPK